MTMTTRRIARTFAGQPTLEGAGVRLHRAFGFAETPLFDPFLMLDDFSSERPEDYLAGFPWHPHRGIETITMVFAGLIEHGDSLGNSGAIGAGEVQWMTAGSGIIHQEMPRRTADGVLQGLQLWANLPAADKMMAPRYRDLAASAIAEVSLAGGGRVRVIAGELCGARGPVDDIVIDPTLAVVELQRTTRSLPMYFPVQGLSRKARTAARTGRARPSSTSGPGSWCGSRPRQEGCACCSPPAGRWASRWPGAGRSS
jgi:redox-sensitive bicupin YhaK (pirin superfamily)